MQLSDPQFGMYTANADFAQETANFEFAIAAANRLHPAFVVVTGDLVNKEGDAAQIAEYQRIAAKLDRAIPLYNVTGNHDVGNNPTPATLAAYTKQFGPDHYTFRADEFVGIVLDSSISDAQAQAVERIMSGQEGGPFADFAPLISKFDGVSRGSVSFSEGENPSASVSGVGDLGFEPVMGPAGATTVKGAPFAFAPEYRIGRSSGTAEILGKSVEFKYAESAAFEYSSEGEGQTARA